MPQLTCVAYNSALFHCIVDRSHPCVFNFTSFRSQVAPFITSHLRIFVLLISFVISLLHQDGAGGLSVLRLRPCARACFLKAVSSLTGVGVTRGAATDGCHRIFS